ncbi:MAG TPA: hypothetical protein VH143_04500 [Kofleriaceae bacterium]|nr:hypothetical protein [Kofleriaceae bacterium]
MLFLATVDGQGGVHFVVLSPVRYRFEVNTRPRPALGTRLAITLPALAAPTRAALDDWRARNAPTGELVPPYYREAALADLMGAVNADLHLDLARAASADELAAFALDRGGALLADLRAALAAGTLDAAPIFAARVARFAQICGIATAAETLAELATMHPVEQLHAFEHAVVQWMQATTEPPADELAALAKQLPDDRASAGASRAWFRWWWRLAYRAPRGDLRDAVVACVELARRECGAAPIAADALAEATRLIDHLRIARATRLWAEPPDTANAFPPATDLDDAHYCAYMALTHAAHAIAAVLIGDHDAGNANRAAMQLLAVRALETLRHGE